MAQRQVQIVSHAQTTIPSALLLKSPPVIRFESFADTATDEEIERAASFFVEMLRAPLSIGSGPQDLDKIFGLMKRALEEPEKLKSDIIREAKNTEPGQLQTDLAFAREFMRSPRKTVIGIIGQALPAGAPGKRPQITPATEKWMVDMARILWPAVQSLIELRHRSSRRTIDESLNYLDADHPEASKLLLKHIEALESLFSATDQPKRIQAKARRIIFEVLSRELKVSPSYVERFVGPYLKPTISRH